MKDIKYRYENDPVFRAMVMSFLDMYNMHAEGITPTEVREAAGFAWQMYCERNMHPSFMIHPTDHDSFSRP